LEGKKYDMTNMAENAKRCAQILKILSNENRLLILCCLIDHPRTVGEVAGFVPHISLSALSQHLNILKTAGLLSSNKVAQSVTYAIADSRVLDLLWVIQRHYCQEPSNAAEQQLAG
jgi:DNA-binding transcriptional ArsR family regulator